jgi:ribosomal protein L37AE/L43A
MAEDRYTILPGYDRAIVVNSDEEFLKAKKEHICGYCGEGAERLSRNDRYIAICKKCDSEGV